MKSPKPRLGHICLLAILFPAFTLLADAAGATGHYVVYCDGIGIFLANIDGAPAPGKLFLYSNVDFPPGTSGGIWLNQGRWSHVVVIHDGCFPGGKCPVIAEGNVWIDELDKNGEANPAPKNLSGKYEIDLNGKHLEGRFVASAKRRLSKYPQHVCE